MVVMLMMTATVRCTNEEIEFEIAGNPIQSGIMLRQVR